jgi:hypothetical protein
MEKKPNPLLVAVESDTSVALRFGLLDGFSTSSKLRPIIFPRLATPPLTQTSGF